MRSVALSALLLVGLLPLTLTGCRGGGSPGTAHVEQKSYRLQGRVVAVDGTNGHVTVDHKAIPGFMEAMTMSYKLADPSVASELHPGDLIVARLLADEDAAGPVNLRLDNIVVTAQANPNVLPPVQYHVPKPGEAVPDFHLLDQSGKHFDLKELHGKVVLLTFIYTRCPLADYCPRMSGNFAEIDKALKTDPAAYAKTHLLSISFDPKYDTPAVLRSYGGAHTGRFTEEDFKHWQFAAPSLADLPELEKWFDLGVTPGKPGDPSILTHSLSTLVIGKDGKVIAWYPTNDWKPADVLAQVRAAAK
jgi:protein SCO1/2